MKRTILTIASLACLTLAGCGDSSGGKKAMTKRDQSNAPKHQGTTAEGGKSGMVEGPDPSKKP